LAPFGGKALIIDLDPQGDSAATMLGLAARFTVREQRLLDGQGRPPHGRQGKT
jgi:cellulose biosynthesis protein BcsQ